MKRLTPSFISLMIWSLLTGVLYSFIVPLWEFPDEQAHMSQVAWQADIGKPWDGDDRSREIYQAELFLGTVRDEQGRNFYTYSPDFKPAYTQGITGVYETQLRNLPDEYRYQHQGLEAARYPFLFYTVTGWAYQLASPFSLIERVFASRLVSVGLTTISLGVIYSIGRHLFKSEFIGLVLAWLLSFQPMFRFVGSGVNNDNLLNTLSLIFIGLTLSMVKYGNNPVKASLFGLVGGLGILVKPLMIPLILAGIVVLILDWYCQRYSIADQLKFWLPGLILGVLAGGWMVLEPLISTGRLPYIVKAKPGSGQADLSLIAYLQQQIPRYYRETFVWYWGVFKWLGQVLPLWSIRSLKLVLAGLAAGLLGFLWRYRTQSRVVIACLVIALGYIGVITFWDYDMIVKNGFSHGLQGRYFFPTIGSHLILFILGFLGWTKTKSHQVIGLCFLVAAMFGLWLISIDTLIQSYYHQVLPLKSLLQQMSQYKPLILKYPGILVWGWLWLSSGLIATYGLIQTAIKTAKSSRPLIQE